MCWRSKTPNKKKHVSLKRRHRQKATHKSPCLKSFTQKGHPGQPNRKLHEKHLKKLNTFLQSLGTKTSRKKSWRNYLLGGPMGPPNKNISLVVFLFFVFNSEFLRLFSFVNLCKFFFCHFFYGCYMVNHHHWATTIRNMFLFFPTTIKLWEIHQNHSRWNTLKIYTIFSKEDPQKEAAP